MAESTRAKSARAEILDRISRALADRPEPAPVVRNYNIKRDDVRCDDVRCDDVVALFAARVADYRANVQMVSGDELTDAISQALHARGADQVAVPGDAPEPWWVPGVDWVADSAECPLGVAELDRVGGVLTGAAVAIAETGTIVLDGGAGQGRRALTLVPDYHLCVVFAEQIVRTVPEAIARLEPTRPLTFISGPSATSDIELSRVEGVHGPRTLDVLMVTG
ncbi:MAG: LutC/YkgG family protein [Sciscionella sp.]